MRRKAKVCFGVISLDDCIVVRSRGRTMGSRDGVAKSGADEREKEERGVHFERERGWFERKTKGDTDMYIKE